MKKLCSVLLSVCLLALPMSASVLADDLNAAPQVQYEQAGFLPGSVPADSSLTDGISLPLTALALSMLEGNLSYDASNDSFVWNTLYYVLTLFGHEDDRAEVTEQALLLPSECVLDFFSALFGHDTTLPSVPIALSDRVTYDAGLDRYAFALGDLSLADIELGTLSPTEAGLFTLDGTLTAPADGHVLCSFRATLEENDTMFGFSIVNFVFS